MKKKRLRGPKAWTPSFYSSAGTRGADDEIVLIDCRHRGFSDLSNRNQEPTATAASLVTSLPGYFGEWRR